MGKKDNTHFVLLGAGRPSHGEQHSVLRGISDNNRVMDWVMQAVAFLQPSVTFVGGYQIDEITRRYPELHYVISPEWETTGAVASLLHTNLRSDIDHFVSYADVLYRESVVREMALSNADIVVAVDSAWRERFSGRTEEDLQRCEKVNCHTDSITRLGSDIEPVMADAEFIGLVRLGPTVIDYLRQNGASLRQRLKHAYLSELIEVLRMRGFGVTAVDVAGEWAELNEPQDLAHFVLGTKAQTLARLQGMVRRSRIEDQVSFSVAEWREKNGAIIAEISKTFGGSALVVRSSTLSEDGFLSANAGAYSSILGVDSRHLSQIQQSIDKVIDSYSDANPVNQVLVQPMVNNVLASGVAFTRTLAEGGPYFVVNYDDETSSTESITSGKSSEHKTLLVHRNMDLNAAQLPTLLRGLFPAIREIENLLNFESLDIEFAITANEQVHILQVRPIAVDHSWQDVEDSEIEAVLCHAEEFFQAKQIAPPYIVGDRALFGVMPDWNPAEIIGTNPGVLAITLYRFLIMDEIWATQRAEYGYRDVRPHPLLTMFCGRPYVDIRASFNSFIPSAIDDALAARLVDFYFGWLERHPHLHDKVEFEVLPTCFDLDFGRWSERLVADGGFSIPEVEALGQALRTITLGALTRNAADLGSIGTLEARYAEIMRSDLAPLERATTLLEDVRRFGTLAFSHLARSAFVAVTLLRSAVRIDAIGQEAMDEFLQSIRTVTHGFTDDALATSRGEVDWDGFVNKYGHLRPGTYDINSLSYADAPDRFLRPIVTQAAARSGANESSDDHNSNWLLQRESFARACNNVGLPGDIEVLEQFMREAIEGREYAKFAFTRNVSSALDCLVDLGAANGLSRSELADIPIDSFIALRTGSLVAADLGQWLKDIARTGEHQRALACMIELPPLIIQAKDFRVFEYPSSQPNFVGKGRAVAECVDLGVCEEQREPLEGKIALIPQADPGYDWLFGQGIAGLVTMYGGANSHMAIRAAEFGLPAAIGVGETEFHRLSVATTLELDAGNRRIQIIQ